MESWSRRCEDNVVGNAADIAAADSHMVACGRTHDHHSAVGPAEPLGSVADIAADTDVAGTSDVVAADSHSFQSRHPWAVDSVQRYEKQSVLDAAADTEHSRHYIVAAAGDEARAAVVDDHSTDSDY